MRARRLVPQSSTVYTPADLARAMVMSVCDDHDCIWLDPCSGDGAFVAAISGIGVPSSRIVSLDLSRRSSPNDLLAQTARGVDFVSWASLRGESVDRVVMNPPYVALGRLRGAPLRRALQVSFPSGKMLSLGSNYWCAFVLQALRCLRKRGRMAVVLPAAWDYARYARAVRDAVYGGFREVIVLRSAAPIFMPTAKEGSVVVVGLDRGQTPTAVRRIDVANPELLADELKRLAKPFEKRGTSVIRHSSTQSRPTTPLRDLVDIRIGAVTGDARYFLIRESTRLEYDLPRSALRPVITRSRHLTSAFMGPAEWRRLLEEDERVWLFRPSEAALTHPAVKKYLKFGEEGGCHLGGHKIVRRTPWYRTPLPKTPDAFLSGMSTLLPCMMFREMPGLTATNTLYTLRFRGSLDSASRLALGILLLTSDVRNQLRRHGRNYPGGLLKFEPENLYCINVPWPVTAGRVRSVLGRATAHLLVGKESDAEGLANDWLADQLAGRVRTFSSGCLRSRISIAR
jgi:adenine-specific DNA-methyltransferase